MERREWWTDDLITAVCAAGNDGEVDYWMTSDQVYRIIAAVEDWYRGRADELSVVDVIWGKARLAQAEAAIQRVRGVLANLAPCNSAHTGDDCDLLSCEILRALDGGTE